MLEIILSLGFGFFCGVVFGVLALLALIGYMNNQETNPNASKEESD